MNAFNDNKNSFLSSIQLLKPDFHSFIVSSVPKELKSTKYNKKAIINLLTNTIDNIDTKDFGIRVILLRTKN